MQYDVGGVNVGKAHLLTDVINNIEDIASDFYERKTLAVVLRERDPLLPLLQDNAKAS